MCRVASERNHNSSPKLKKYDVVRRDDDIYVVA
jgi:hypothetical protein